MYKHSVLMKFHAKVSTFHRTKRFYNPNSCENYRNNFCPSLNTEQCYISSNGLKSILWDCVGIFASCHFHHTVYIGRKTAILAALKG